MKMTIGQSAKICGVILISTILSGCVFVKEDATDTTVSTATATPTASPTKSTASRFDELVEKASPTETIEDDAQVIKEDDTDVVDEEKTPEEISDDKTTANENIVFGENKVKISSIEIGNIEAGKVEVNVVGSYPDTCTVGKYTWGTEDLTTLVIDLGVKDETKECKETERAYLNTITLSGSSFKPGKDYTVKVNGVQSSTFQFPETAE